MNVMSSELSPLCNHVGDCINASTTADPYTSAHVVRCIEMEQQLIDGEKQCQMSLALAATTHCPSNAKPHSTKMCLNCGGTGHTDDECWKEGGGHTGQRDAILAEKRAARAARGTKNKPSTAKPTIKVPTGAQATHGLRYDTSGRAYILDSTSGEAIFIATPSTTPTPSIPTPPGEAQSSRKFARLAYNPIIPAFIQAATAEDLAEYDALFNAINVSTSIDWRAHTCDVALASIMYQAPNQHAATIIDPALDMFYLNSSASVHISNTEADFFALQPTTPHAVNGIGGSSILVVGIGSIKLTIAKGLHLILHDVLFIPSATVCLISVSALCAQTRCFVHFDDNTCWVTACNGTHVLNGALSARRLYSLTGGQLSMEHALLVHRLSTLHTWHGHLSHANYRTIYDLACEGRATGIVTVAL